MRLFPSMTSARDKHLVSLQRKPARARLKSTPTPFVRIELTCKSIPETFEWRVQVDPFVRVSASAPACGPPSALGEESVRPRTDVCSKREAALPKPRQASRHSS